jgi:tetratricopeptide (TPR) repeat protein
MVPGICVLLALAVFAVFSQTLWHPFVNYDDNEYVYENPQVMKGLTLHGIGWAFTTSLSGYWHPLTWLSHMLDCQIWGLNAGGYHLTNVLFHAANVVLLFLVLRRMMSLHPDKSAGAAASQAGALWPSAFVAAVFAIHPLNVESVAWVAERKNVLSTFFWLLTMGAYLGYVNQPGWRRYGLVISCYVLGLMSKPMLVTLPFVLLLLDWWPLHRFERSKLRPLLLEKVPLFLLAVASSVVTYLGQKRVGAVMTLEQSHFGVRLAKVPVNYVTYLWHTVWPEELLIPYPYPPTFAISQVVMSAALLAGITLLVLWAVRSKPYAAVGWFWFLGTLVPVIGLVQVGTTPVADRFTYVPQIGLYLMVAWAARDLTASWRYRRQILGATAAMVITALMVCAAIQTSYWRDSESLWIHTLACTSGNYIAHGNLANTLADQGRSVEAIEHYQKAIEINPAYAEAENNLATVLLAAGRLGEAIEHCQRALEIDPNFAEAYYNLGCAFDNQGRSAEAIGHYQKAIELNPDLAEAHHNLGALFSSQGRLDETVKQYQRAIEIKPDNARAHYDLAGVFGLRNQLAEAIEHYRKAIEIKPDYVDAHGNLANALAAQGRLDEALKEYQRTLELVPHSAQTHYKLALALQTQHHFAAASAEYQRALELDPQHLPARLNLAWLLATCPEASLRNGNRAVALARQAEQLADQGESPRIFDTLAAAYAEAGRFDEAVETARRALKLNATQNNQPLAEAIQSRLKLYEAHSPYHEKL